ncbi:MAG: hypothetical protein KDC98_17885 [Planctomycetes bacterium]|nr:hypothetical protein [Planctomycetota bacterium]
MRRFIVLSALLLGSCAVPHAIDSLGEKCPPAELGRPMWVRACAGVGAWVGGIVGGVASIVALPVTYPISLMAEDELGPNGRTEFLLFPALSGAAIGHAFLGGASDVLDFTLRRAWFGSSDAVTSYEFTPQEGPRLPQEEGGS